MATASLDITDRELLQYFQKFKKTIELKDKRIGFRSYKDVFSGKKAVTCICSLFNLQKDKAIQLGESVRTLRFKILFNTKNYSFFL